MLHYKALLVETGMLLLKKKGLQGGIVTPAVAFQSDLLQQILSNLDASFEIQDGEESPSS